MKQRAILPVLTPIAQQEIPQVKGDTAKLLADLERHARHRPTGALMRKTNDQHLAIVRALRAGDIDRALRELARNLETFGPDGRTA